ncbi:hypothetical protein N2152v2_008972 [Parachlorella kessleri]
MWLVEQQHPRVRTREHRSSVDQRRELPRQFASANYPSDALDGSVAAIRHPPEPDGASSSSSSNGHSQHGLTTGPQASARSKQQQQSQQKGGAARSQPQHPPSVAHAAVTDQSLGQHNGSNGGHHGHGVPPGAPVWKLRMGRYLESNECHMIVISLVMLDLTIVVTELILGSLFTHGQPMPHAVHVAEEILSWSSIGILGLFATELLAKLICFGSQYFAHSRWHFFDAVVVTLSLGLELTLKGVAGEAASLLMFFRLWKYTPEFMRVARHAPEVAEAARVARHSPELVRALSHMPEAARVLRHSPEVARVFRHVPEALRVFHYIPEFFRFVRHTPELFRLWRVARIAHASAEAMALATAKDQEEQRQLLAKELATEKGRRLDLEAEVVALRQVLTPAQQAQVAAELLAGLPSSKPGAHQDRVWEAGLSTAQSMSESDSENGSYPGGIEAKKRR